MGVKRLILNFVSFDLTENESAVLPCTSTACRKQHETHGQVFSMTYKAPSKPVLCRAM